MLGAMHRFLIADCVDIYIDQRIITVLVLAVGAIVSVVACTPANNAATSPRTIINTRLCGEVVDRSIIVDLPGVFFERRLQLNVHTRYLSPLIKLIPHRRVYILDC